MLSKSPTASRPSVLLHSDLVRRVAARARVSQTEAADVVAALGAAIATALVCGRRVQLRRLGSFWAAPQTLGVAGARARVGFAAAAEIRRRVAARVGRP